MHAACCIRAARCVPPWTYHLRPAGRLAATDAVGAVFGQIRPFFGMHTVHQPRRVRSVTRNAHASIQARQHVILRLADVDDGYP